MAAGGKLEERLSKEARAAAPAAPRVGRRALPGSCRAERRTRRLRSRRLPTEEGTAPLQHTLPPRDLQTPSLPSLLACDNRNLALSAGTLAPPARAEQHPRAQRPPPARTQLVWWAARSRTSISSRDLPHQSPASTPCPASHYRFFFSWNNFFSYAEIPALPPWQRCYREEVPRTLPHSGAERSRDTADFDTITARYLSQFTLQSRRSDTGDKCLIHRTSISNYGPWMQTADFHIFSSFS